MKIFLRYLWVFRSYCGLENDASGILFKRCLLVLVSRIITDCGILSSLSLVFRAVILSFLIISLGVLQWKF